MASAASSSTTSSSSSTSTTMAVVSGLAVMAAAGALLWYATRSPASEGPTKGVLRESKHGGQASSSAAAASSDASGEADGASGGSMGAGSVTISKTTLCEIFAQITNEMSKVIMQIGQLEQHLLQQAAEQGKQIDPDALREHLLQEFTAEVRDAEAAVYARHGVSQADVEAAAKYFHDDADFQAAVKTLKRKFALFTGQASEEVPAHVTMELVMSVLEETMSRMTAAMEEVFHQTKEKSPVGTEAFNAQLQTAYVERVAVIRQKVQKKYGIDQEMLQAGVIKYQNNPSFQRKMVELTNAQREAFAKLGL